MKRAFPLVALLSVGAVGCQDYLFDQKFAAEVQETDLVIPEITPTPADILFVVDNSNSMADEQELLAASFKSFADKIAGTGSYRIAVITTDVNSPKEMAGYLTPEAKTEAPYTITNPDNSCAPTRLAASCFRGDVKGDATRGEFVDTATQNKDDQIRTFQRAVKVGSCGSPDERGLQAVKNALSKTVEGGCNAGFLRDDANLIIVFVSDEGDASKDDDGTWLDSEKMLNVLKKYKPLGRIRIAAIVGADADGKASNCRIDGGATVTTCGEDLKAEAACCQNSGAGGCTVPSWCGDISDKSKLTTQMGLCSYYSTPDCCSAVGGRAYVKLALDLENALSATDSSIAKSSCQSSSDKDKRPACLVESICQENFGDALARIATELVISSKMTLSPAPVNPEGVHIEIRGGRFPNGKVLEYGTDFTIKKVDDDLAYLDLKVVPEPPDESLQVSYVTKVVDESPKDDK